MGGIAHKLYGSMRMVRCCRDWRAWFREYATKPADDGPTRYRMRNGVVLNTRRNRMDLHMIDEIWAFRKYDYFGFEVRPGDVVVDVGANIGSFALYAATERRAMRVIALEPHPANFAVLEANVTENGARNVECSRSAVAGTAGTALLEVTPHNSGGHHLTATSGARTVEVPCTTLDDIVDEQRIETIDYLKLDCEGSEYDILASARDDTIRRIRRISMEYHPVPGHAPHELGDTLARHGFRVRYHEADRLYAERIG
jgi:FkbM family methyltransferase